MGFMDLVKNVFKIRQKETGDEVIDLKHANLESAEGNSVELDDDDALDQMDNKGAKQIDKSSIAGKQSVVKDSPVAAAQKVELRCQSCNYKFKRAEDNIPKMCPYCGKGI